MIRYVALYFYHYIIIVILELSVFLLQLWIGLFCTGAYYQVTDSRI